MEDGATARKLFTGSSMTVAETNIGALQEKVFELELRVRELGAENQASHKHQRCLA